MQYNHSSGSTGRQMKIYPHYIGNPRDFLLSEYKRIFLQEKPNLEAVDLKAAFLAPVVREQPSFNQPSFSQSSPRSMVYPRNPAISVYDRKKPQNIIIRTVPQPQPLKKSSLNREELKAWKEKMNETLNRHNLTGMCTVIVPSVVSESETDKIIPDILDIDAVLRICYAGGCLYLQLNEFDEEGNRCFLPCSTPLVIRLQTVYPGTKYFDTKLYPDSIHGYPGMIKIHQVDVKQFRTAVRRLRVEIRTPVYERIVEDATRVLSKTVKLDFNPIESCFL